MVSTRRAVVTASARSLPSRISPCAELPTSAKIIFRWPATTSWTAGPPPRNSYYLMSRPAMVRSSSAFTSRSADAAGRIVQSRIGLSQEADEIGDRMDRHRGTHDQYEGARDQREGAKSVTGSRAASCRGRPRSRRSMRCRAGWSVHRAPTRRRSSRRWWCPIRGGSPPWRAGRSAAPIPSRSAPWRRCRRRRRKARQSGRAGWDSPAPARCRKAQARWRPLLRCCAYGTRRLPINASALASGVSCRASV